MTNTTGSEDRVISGAQTDIETIISDLIQIIERFDGELADAKEQIESLERENEELRAKS